MENKAMANRGKNYRKASENIDRVKVYGLDEGLELALKGVYAKFDESVDIAIRLGVDPRHADQMVRSSVVLPNGTGKEIRMQGQTMPAGMSSLKRYRAAGLSSTGRSPRRT